MIWSVGNAVSSPAGPIEENRKKGLEWETFPATVMVGWSFGINKGIPGNTGRTQSFPSVAPGIGQPQEIGFLWFGRAGSLKSRVPVNGMTIRALGVVE